MDSHYALHGLAQVLWWRGCTWMEGGGRQWAVKWKSWIDCKCLCNSETTSCVHYYRTRSGCPKSHSLLLPSMYFYSCGCSTAEKKVTWPVADHGRANVSSFAKMSLASVCKIWGGGGWVPTSVPSKCFIPIRVCCLLPVPDVSAFLQPLGP